MQPTEAGMGARDEFYDLVAVLYHALHGAETIGMYVRDAEAAGNEQLVTFFRQAQDSQRQLAEQAREQLRALEGGALWWCRHRFRKRGARCAGHHA